MSLLQQSTIYVRVFPNRFVVRHIESGKEVAVDSLQPFTTCRLLIGEFTPAGDILRDAFRQLLLKRGLHVAPTVVMHQTTQVEGGLSTVENRVLLEVADYAGAKKAIVWVGAHLSDDEVRDKARAA
jgi:hypothetical protein